MAPKKNPYLNKDGSLNLAKWSGDLKARTSSGGLNLIDVAKQAGYRFSPKEGYSQVASYDVARSPWGMVKGGNQATDKFTLYSRGGAPGGAGAGGSRSGSGSGSGGPGIDPNIAALGEMMAGQSAANQALFNSLGKQNNKLLKQISNNKGTTNRLEGALSDAQSQFSDLEQFYQGLMATQGQQFSQEFAGFQAQAGEAERGYQAQLAASRAQMEELQSMFTGQLAAALSERNQMAASYEAQLRQTQALQNAFIPNMERTAAAPQLGDNRTEQQTRRPRSRNTLSDLSIASGGILGGLTSLSLQVA